jgi:2-polyprenyl-3-methyl-5-hydroxy-6-metoxy-1,4-benzoquinol methylase
VSSALTTIWIVRAYCWGRFGILRQRFLDEIGQYLPERGRVLDVGCGFGLFSLYYATVRRRLTVRGPRPEFPPIAMAQAAAGASASTNVRYEVGDATALSRRRALDAAYMLDIVHHIPPDAVRPAAASSSPRRSRPAGGSS